MSGPLMDGPEAPAARRLLPMEVAGIGGLGLLYLALALEPAEPIAAMIVLLLAGFVLLILGAFGIWSALTRSGHWSTRLREAIAVPLALTLAVITIGGVSLQARLWHADAHLSRNEQAWRAAAAHSPVPVAFPYRNGMLGGDQSIVYDGSGRLSATGELPVLGPYRAAPIRCDQIRGPWYLCIFD